MRLRGANFRASARRRKNSADHQAARWVGRKFDRSHSRGGQTGGSGGVVEELLRSIRDRMDKVKAGRQVTGHHRGGQGKCQHSRNR